MAATVVRVGAVDATGRSSSNRARRGVASEIVFALALLLSWGLIYVLCLSAFQAGHAQSALYGELRSDLAAGLAPTGAPIAAGTPVALLDVAKADVTHQVVVEGASADLLRNGPGHVRGTVLPGQVGTSVLAARSLTFGAPFRDLAALPNGSEIVVRTQQGRFTFRVIGVRNAGDPIPPVDAGASRLVLVTSSGSGALSRSGTSYVDADLVGTAVAAGPVSQADPADAPMSHDTSVGTLAMLALGVQLVLLALAWIVWARVRWSVLAAWSTGVPALVAALWLASSVASRLLPNLI